MTQENLENIGTVENPGNDAGENQANNSSGEEIKEENSTEEEIKEEESAGEEPFDFSALLPDSMEEILKLTLLQMQEWSYVYMGLRLNPKKKTITRDMRQAKMAIDSASSLVEILLPHISQAEQKELKVLVTDLRMNFIAKSTES